MESSINWNSLFFSPMFVFCLIPLLAILVGGVTSIVKLLIKHRERMAMIQQGIHPDWRDTGAGDPR